MPKNILLAFTSPVEGRDAEFNEWYDNQHLPDVCRAPGFVSARRFKLIEGESEHKYLAVYEMVSDDARRDFETLGELSGTDQVVMSDALDTDNAVALLYEEITST